MGTQANKDQILAFWAALDAAEAAEIISVCNKHLAPDFIWQGPAPLSLQTSPKAVADSFWHPLKQAIPDLKREIHMIFGCMQAISGALVILVPFLTLCHRGRPSR